VPATVARHLEQQRDEAVNNYETAVLREHRMQEQLDALKESIMDLSHPNIQLLLEERNEVCKQRDRLAVILDVCLREMLDVVYACNEQIEDVNDTFHQAIKLGQKTLDGIKEDNHE
jgi:TolA-binding protein